MASFLRATPMFRHLSKEQLTEVAEQVEFATYGDYDWSGDYKRLARAGTVTPEQEPIIVRQGELVNQQSVSMKQVVGFAGIFPPTRDFFGSNAVLIF